MEINLTNTFLFYKLRYQEFEDYFYILQIFRAKKYNVF